MTTGSSAPEGKRAARGRLLRGLRWIDRNVEYWLNFLFYAFLTLIIVIEVFRRYALNSSTSYGEELARYAFIWLAYIATARGVKNRSHLSIDMLRQRCGRSGQFWLYVFSDLCFLALALVVVYTSVLFVGSGIRFDQRFTGSDLPLWLATAAVPVGWSLIGIRVVQRNLALIAAYRTGGPLTAGVGIGSKAD